MLNDKRNSVGQNPKEPRIFMKTSENLNVGTIFHHREESDHGGSLQSWQKQVMPMFYPAAYQAPMVIEPSTSLDDRITVSPIIQEVSTSFNNL